MEKVEFMADKVTVYGPKVDGSMTVKFETGEYEKGRVAKVLTLPSDVGYKITVELVSIY